VDVGGCFIEGFIPTLALRRPPLFPTAAFTLLSLLPYPPRLSQIGDTSPDVDPAVLKAAFNATQQLIGESKLLAGHDISDGGIATTVCVPLWQLCTAVLAALQIWVGYWLLDHHSNPILRLLTIPCLPLPCLPACLQVLEMAFAGNCGISVDLPAASTADSGHGAMAALFAEELGLVLEVSPEHEAAVLAAYAAAGVACARIGATLAAADVSIAVAGQQQVAGTTPALRDVWEATSFQLERLQCAEECVEVEQAGLATRQAPQWRVPFTPAWTPADKLGATGACALVPAGGIASAA
jgi:phosphoribosylformylglycinamidine synthase